MKKEDLTLEILQSIGRSKQNQVTIGHLAVNSADVTRLLVKSLPSCERCSEKPATVKLHGTIVLEFCDRCAAESIHKNVGTIDSWRDMPLAESVRRLRDYDEIIEESCPETKLQ